MQPKAIITSLRVCAFALAMLTMGTTFLSAQTFTTLHSFRFDGNDGFAPFAGLILSGNTLYGTTYMGGSSDEGTVFSVTTNGTGYATLHSFSFFSSGSGPLSTLALSGNTLYGTTLASGTMFSVNTVSTNFTTLYSFSGGNSWAGVILSGTTLYGGLDSGTVFSINTDGTDFTTLTNVGGAIQTGLILFGNALYGTTLNGGSPGNGTVFSVNADGTDFTVLHSFTAISNNTNSDGAEPYCCLILSQNILYGTTDHGGSAGNGTVFAINTDGTGFTILHSFTAVSNSTNSDGIRPQAGLILSGNTLFGTAGAGGSAGNGTVFAVNTDGTCFTTLHSFTSIDHNTGTNSDGTGPLPLILSGNTLYGAATGGGSFGAGTVFALSLAPSAPVITTQPQSQAAPSGSNVTFTVIASGMPAPNYQWLFNGQPIPTATNAAFILQANILTALAGGGYSVVVWNAYGTNTSATASLKLLGIDTSLNLLLMTAGPLPARQAGKTNLILVTHGLEAGPQFQPPPAWVSNLCSSIQTNVASDWQVVPYFWTTQAWAYSSEVPVLSQALSLFGVRELWDIESSVMPNAKNLGTQIGTQIANQGWQHVHLIGHSAGSALIQSAADAIRAIAPNTIIQTTFLDPYLDLDYNGLAWYGSNADWSDSYFSYDLQTGTFTQGALAHSYNVDVTWIDPAVSVTPVYNPGNLNQFSPQIIGYNGLSSHGWPYEFYQETVLGTETNCAAGYGFPLSMEGGGWNNRLSHPEGSAPQEPCGTRPFSQNTFAVNAGPPFQIGVLPNAMSSLGATITGISGINLSSTSLQISPHAKFTSSTNSPAWFAVGLTVTNFVNFVQFDAACTDSNNAEGLLTVYWDTNQIGTVDERVVSPGLQTHRFFLPNTVTTNVYVLGFRLDAFDNTATSIAVTNVVTGFVGITTPLTLGISFTNGTPLLQLTGAANYNYLVQTSTNLVNWTPTALLVNSNGTVLFPDSTATNSCTKFYRAVMP